MRILYLIAGYGDEHLVYESDREFAQEIIARGHSYTVFTLVRQRQVRGRKIDAVEHGVPVHRAICAGTKPLDAVNLVTQPIFKFPWFLTTLWQFVAYLRTHRDFDVIISEGAYPFGAIVYLATRWVRMPYVVYVHGGDFIANREANYGYGRYALARQLMRIVFRAAGVVRCESPYGAVNARKLDCPPQKLALAQRNIARCSFLPTDVDLASYRRAARDRVRHQFNLTARLLIVTAGRLLPIKGVDDLVRALPRVIASGCDVQLLHVGPNRVDSRLGDYQKYLQKLAGEIGVADRIAYAGAVPLAQVREFLAAADVAAVPSVEEGGNKTVMEAAAVGTPFVASNTAGTPEWATEWDCGLMVAPRAPDQLAEALVRVLSNPPLAREMGKNGLNFAEEFRPERVAERILGLCEVAVKQVPVPRELKQPDALLHPSQARTHTKTDSASRSCG